MIYRDVLKYGLHDFSGMKDLYILNCDQGKPRVDLIERYIYLQLVFLYPICPHFC
jgi:leucyl-tRNA synthetase